MIVQNGNTQKRKKPEFWIFTPGAHYGVKTAVLVDVEYSVDEYFEPEELVKMSPIEKRRYKNFFFYIIV